MTAGRAVARQHLTTIADPDIIKEPAMFVPRIVLSLEEAVLCQGFCKGWIGAALYGIRDGDIPLPEKIWLSTSSYYPPYNEGGAPDPKGMRALRDDYNYGYTQGVLAHREGIAPETHNLYSPIWGDRFEFVAAKERGEEPPRGVVRRLSARYVL